MKKNKIYLTKFTAFAVFLAFIVIVLGAYTRLTDAGLGCPDWPGCYHQLIAPTSQNAILHADQLYPTMPVHVIKAWTEMVHRYVAGILGLIIFGFGLLAIKRALKPLENDRYPKIVVFLLVGLVIFQALLGKWTVTMKLLPVVVMGHLLGGFAIISLLWWLNLRAGNYFKNTTISHRFKPWALLGLIIVIAQIALGGWTSSNYAALVCPDFPYCSAQGFFPQVDFADAFNIFHITNTHLSHAALITIQMTHRFGAMLTGLYVGVLAIVLMRRKQAKAVRYLGLAIFSILILQIALGVLNIEWLLPLPIAVLHNAVAALLLLSMVTFLYVSFKRKVSND